MFSCLVKNLSKKDREKLYLNFFKNNYNLFYVRNELEVLDITKILETKNIIYAERYIISISKASFYIKFYISLDNRNLYFIDDEDLLIENEIIFDNPYFYLKNNRYYSVKNLDRAFQKK